MLGLKLRRINIAQPGGNWEAGALETQTSDVTLTAPDGHVVEASRIDFGGAGQWAFQVGLGLIEADASMHIAAGVKVTSFEPGMFVEVAAGTGGPVYGPAVEVPVWPQWVEISTPTGSQDGTHAQTTLRGSSAGTVYVFDTALVLSPDLPIDTTFFDGNSTSDTYQYIPLAYSRSAEVLPVTSGGDYPLIPAVRIEFWRSADGGKTWQRVGDAGSDWSLVDTQPPLLARLLYKARAYAEQGGWAESGAVEVSAKACDAFVHYAGIVLRGGYEPSYTGTAGRQSVLRRYVGRDKPSAVFGDRVERVQTYRITLLDDSTPLARWVTAAEHPGTVTVRDPGGRVLVGVLSDFSWDDSTEDEQTVSFTVTESEALL